MFVRNVTHNSRNMKNIIREDKRQKLNRQITGVIQKFSKRYRAVHTKSDLSVRKPGVVVSHQASIEVNSDFCPGICFAVLFIFVERKSLR